MKVVLNGHSSEAHQTNEASFLRSTNFLIDINDLVKDILRSLVNMQTMLWFMETLLKKLDNQSMEANLSFDRALIVHWLKTDLQHLIP